MKLHADLALPALVHGAEIPWVPSPSAGVERRMLYRVGEEVARATTIVRYAPGSAFPAHTHGGGEEYFVLEGVFRDEAGDHGAGSYVRNPPGSRHTPSAPPGCTIIVWLRQFLPGDDVPVDQSLDEREMSDDAPAAGIVRRPFDGGPTLDVWHDDATPEASAEIAFPHGGEVFVLEGNASTDREHALGRWSWMRIPAGQKRLLSAGREGARWLVRRHRRDIRAALGEHAPV